MAVGVSRCLGENNNVLCSHSTFLAWGCGWVPWRAEQVESEAFRSSRRGGVFRPGCQIKSCCSISGSATRLCQRSVIGARGHRDYVIFCVPLIRPRTSFDDNFGASETSPLAGAINTLRGVKQAEASQARVRRQLNLMRSSSASFRAEQSYKNQPAWSRTDTKHNESSNMMGCQLLRRLYQRNPRRAKRVMLLLILRR